ncbi:MAG: hypothetical protein O2802_03105 [Proteobacteria bacterium]|jgi:hypothetical protein|nr:hypothetical protein [Pseudomonadota bacterium]MDA1133895.1 hypothetical protein [Pseudomonadota bacterium]
MGWIKLSSIFFLIIFVIFLTLGGREFFEYFDVEVSKKKSDEEVRNTEIIDKDTNTSNNTNEDLQENKPSKSVDDNWSDFN